MTDLSFRQADPGIEVSVKPGMAHTATFAHNRRLPELRLYRRANPDGNPRQLTSEAPGTPYGLAQGSVAARKRTLG